MKRFFILIFLIIFFISTTPKTVFGVGLAFGGTIVSSPSITMIALTSLGYVCDLPGPTINILPANKAPLTYVIPLYLIPKNITYPHFGQHVLGKYLGEYLAICESAAFPEAPIALPFTLITIAGFSKL